MKTPPLSFIFVRSLSFHPSLLILSLSLSPFQQPFNPLPVRFASSRSSNFSLNRSYYVHTPISINLFSSRLFGNRSTTIRRRRRRYDTSLFILYFPPSPLIASSSSRISPRSHPPSPPATCANIVSDGEQIPQSSAPPPRRNRPLRADTSNTLTLCFANLVSLSLPLLPFPDRRHYSDSMRSRSNIQRGRQRCNTLHRYANEPHADLLIARRPST